MKEAWRRFSRKMAADLALCEAAFKARAKRKPPRIFKVWWAVMYIFGYVEGYIEGYIRGLIDQIKKLKY